MGNKNLPPLEKGHLFGPESKKDPNEGLIPVCPMRIKLGDFRWASCSLPMAKHADADTWECENGHVKPTDQLHRWVPREKLP